MNTTLKISALVFAATVALTGCSATKDWLGKRDDGSLDYQSSKKLDPIKLPADQPTAEFTPLYPTPNVGQVDTSLTNKFGKQFALPKPPTVN
ncbi:MULTISPECIES: hypothetical protein [unclassified Moraxella]|uniref:hypothetical protein n=1 Tax=unclassified Moraxella TaxID=2685852 RepID=UPI002B411D53|nr:MULTISPECIES: hypothetical protein [unclassified Moraxella]